MPSKSRGGLSKREYAAQQAGKPMPYASKSTKSGQSTQKNAFSSMDINPNQFGTFKDTSSKLLPQFQQQAASVYDPQIAQLNVLRNLNTSAKEQADITTKKELASRLQSEIEAINRRGAFFSGGAIQNEQNIRDAYAANQFQKDLQYQGQDLGYQSDIAQMGAKKSTYVQDLLSGAQSSAYNQWKDARDFGYQVATGNRTTRLAEIDNALAAAKASKAGSTSGSVSTGYQAQLGKDFSSITRGGDGYMDPRQYRDFAASALANAKTKQELALAQSYIIRGAQLLNPNDKKADSSNDSLTALIELLNAGN